MFSSENIPTQQNLTQKIVQRQKSRFFVPLAEYCCANSRFPENNSRKMSMQSNNHCPRIEFVDKNQMWMNLCDEFDVNETYSYTRSQGVVCSNSFDQTIN